MPKIATGITRGREVKAALLHLLPEAHALLRSYCMTTGLCMRDVLSEAILEKVMRDANPEFMVEYLDALSTAYAPTTPDPHDYGMSYVEAYNEAYDSDEEDF